MFGCKTWSDKFFPTEGLLTIVLIPKVLSSDLSPMPDNWRRIIDPMDPAESMTSWLALICFMGATKINQINTRKFPFKNTCPHYYQS